jgi:hypothetical protein
MLNYCLVSNTYIWSVAEREALISGSRGDLIRPETRIFPTFWAVRCPPKTQQIHHHPKKNGGGNGGWEFVVKFAARQRRFSKKSSCLYNAMSATTRSIPETIFFGRAEEIFDNLNLLTAALSCHGDMRFAESHSIFYLIDEHHA